jgi:hypothetical protein
MNLFRSEEHARAWPAYDERAREQTMPLASWVRIFQAPRYRHRLDPDHLLTKDTFRPTNQELKAQEVAGLRAAGYWENRR